MNSDEVFTNISILIGIHTHFDQVFCQSRGYLVEEACLCECGCCTCDQSQS